MKKSKTFIHKSMAKKGENQEIINIVQDGVIKSMLKSIELLTIQVTSGFKGIHERQDTANGRTGKLENDLILMKEKQKYEKVIWYLFTVAVSTCGVMFTYIFLKH